MASKTVKVYVTAPMGRAVPGLGERLQGAFFEVERDVADRLLRLDGFSEKPPKPAAVEPDAPAAPVEEE